MPYLGQQFRSLGAITLQRQALALPQQRLCRVPNFVQPCRDVRLLHHATSLGSLPRTVGRTPQFANTRSHTGMEETDGVLDVRSYATALRLHPS